MEFTKYHQLPATISSGTPYWSFGYCILSIFHERLAVTGFQNILAVLVLVTGRSFLSSFTERVTKSGAGYTDSLRSYMTVLFTFKMSRIPSDFLNASSSFNETNNLQYISTPGGSSVDLLVMSFPGRPPMVPGIPVPPSMTMPYMGIGAPPPLVPTVGIPMTHMIAPPPLPPMPAPPIRPYRAAPHHHNHTTSAPPAPAPASSIPPLIPPSSNMRSNSFSKRVQQGDTLGPPVTVFVGNITERAPDAMIRHILSACGHVVSWKRVQGASAFGFCEYGGPEAGLRAVRLLHDLEIGGKKLVVKVDAKTKLVLDNYKGNCRLNNEQRKKLKESGTPPPDGDLIKDDNCKDSDGIEETDYMDEVMKHADEVAQERIQQVVADYEMDIKNYTPPASKSEKNERKMSKTQEKLMKLSQGSDMLSGDSTPIFDDQEMEEGKRDLITREIGKFREIMKADRFVEILRWRRPLCS